MSSIHPFGVKVEKKKEERKPKKSRSVLKIISVILSIALGFVSVYSTISTDYFARVNTDLQKANTDLQNLLYNFQPYVFSNYTYYSKLETVAWNPTQNAGYFSGVVTIDLEVISPFDGLLTINATSLIYNPDNKTDYEGQMLLDKNHLNDSIVTTVANLPNGYQYFISRGVATPVKDKIFVNALIYMKPNSFPIYSNNTMIGFDFGDMVFEANLFLFQTNKTITTTFHEDVNLEVSPTT
jgi:hypothetical protein